MNHSKLNVVVLASLALTPLASSSASAQLVLKLSFQGPEKWAVPSGASDVEYFCTLTQENADKGVEGWSLSLTAEGAQIISIDIENTKAKELYNNGFQQNQLTTGPGNVGAVSAVILTFFDSVTLPLNTTSTIARIGVRGGPASAVLKYVDGLRGAGQPVPNVVTQGQVSNFPQLVPFAIQAAEALPGSDDDPEACAVSLGDKISGALADATDRDVYGFSALDGTLLSLKLKGSGALPPGVELRGPSGELLSLSGLLSVKKSTVSFKNFTLPSIGQYALWVNGVEGSPGGYALALKGKAPKSKLSLKTVLSALAGGSTLDVPFSGLGGATLKATLKGKGVSPEFVELVGPLGGPVALPPGILIPGLKTAKIQNLILPATGIYVLRVRGTGVEGSIGTLSLSLKQKAAKGRVLSECAE